MEKALADSSVVLPAGVPGGAFDRAYWSATISTQVSSLGAELASGDGFLALSAMATAGGWVRKCQSASECDTGDTCDASTRSCGRPFYSVQDTAQLIEALSDIMRTLGQ